MRKNLWWYLGTLLLFSTGICVVLQHGAGLGPVQTERAPLSGSAVLDSPVLLFVFGAATFTEVIGIHALFGAFLAGVAISPEARLRGFLRARLETFSAVFLLPLFLVFTGLRTQVGLLDDPLSWALCGGLVLVAIAGKFGGSMLAARWAGMPWREATALGVLMNTRGLIELIVLNIGYDLGILSPRIFTMMVLMALVTTFMTGPLLTWLGVDRGPRLAAARAG
jgi:Kef-type K+ transport system membrane component KefB